tara:strand:+ start:244 stop:1734 length:1491 start_codon:yes stop_codon:yes gene_type:complete
MSKPNSFVKNFKNINKFINNLLEENLNKLKFKNLLNLLRNNKIVLSFVAVFVLFLSYLLLPTLYSKNEISKKLNLDLTQKLNLNFNFSKNIKYNFFPRPHFIIKDSIISLNNQEISKVRKLKVYFSLENLHSLKNININNLLIEDANFELNIKNYDFFLDLLKNNFANNELEIKNSNVFFRNSKNDILFINKILDMKYYLDAKELNNTIISKNELFNFPYELELNKDPEKKKIISKLNFSFLKLKIVNEFDYNNDLKEGKANIILNKSKSNTFYKLNSKFFEFILSDQKDNPNYEYTGKINLNPFYSSFVGETQKLNLSYLLNINSFILQILKTEILNNQNIDFELNIKAKNIIDNVNLVNLNLNSKIKNGLIDIDQTKYHWKDLADFKLTDSLIFVKDGQLILDAKVEVNINKINDIYKYLLTPKNLRKNIKKVVLNFSHNFDQNITTLSDIRLDDKYIQKINTIMNSIVLKDNKLQNKIYLKNLLNEALKYYSG